MATPSTAAVHWPLRREARHNDHRRPTGTPGDRATAATMSQTMPPVHSAPATTTLVPAMAAGPPRDQLLADPLGGSSSDNSDSESSGSPRASGCEDGGGPPPLVSVDLQQQRTAADGEKGAIVAPSTTTVASHASTMRAQPAAIPLSVVQTSNKDPVLTTAILPHCESRITHTHTQLARAQSCPFFVRDLRRCDHVLCIFRSSSGKSASGREQNGHNSTPVLPLHPCNITGTTPVLLRQFTRYNNVLAGVIHSMTNSRL